VRVGARHPDNQLHRETSVYLRQHAENPVAWWPWGTAAFEEARRSQRPVLVSIGYSSCHWCHVMERESFEDPDIAALMNRELVNIKVDREERPDVDQIYMDALMRLTGQGGWPLNVFCLPDGRPFFGGTYFPPRRAMNRPGWPDVVSAIGRLCREQPGKVEEQAEQLLAVLRTWPDFEPVERPGSEVLASLSERMMEGADTHHGGFGQAPKFPMPPGLEALLAAVAIGAAPTEVFAHVRFTLACMARGGIYDQIGGGFHRYSTDAHWGVPHFEKMLYDNGQLLRVYAEAHRQAPDPELAWPVAETIDYLVREMCGPEGGFFASQDADSEGEEGRFYVWDPAQVRAVLGTAQAEEFCDAFGVGPRGSFESLDGSSDKSVLQQLTTAPREQFADMRAKLLESRALRVPPTTDRKRITAWIGYTISGIATAAATWHRSDWLTIAERAVDFLEGQMGEAHGELMRVGDGERARIPAFLDDHAALLSARLDLFRASADTRHVQAALRLAERICRSFYSADRGDLYLTPAGDASLLYRPGTDSDGATPSASGLAVLGLLRTALLCGRSDLASVARSVLSRYAPLMLRTPQALPTLARAAAIDAGAFGLALIVGARDDPRTHALARRARELMASDDFVVLLETSERPDWLDPAWTEGRMQVDQPTAYLCRGQTCSLPASRPETMALP